MVYFCAMSKRFNIVILITFLSAGILTCHAQQQPQTGASKSIYLTPMCVYNGDTIPYVKLPTVYIFKPLKFKNRREMAKYYKLIRFPFQRKSTGQLSRLTNTCRPFPLKKSGKST